MNFIFLILVPGMNSHICKITLSPNYAFVRSNVYVLSVYKPSRIFSYFSGTFMLFSFFLVGLTTLSKAKLSSFVELWNTISWGSWTLLSVEKFSMFLLVYGLWIGFSSMCLIYGMGINLDSSIFGPYSIIVFLEKLGWNYNFCSLIKSWPLS